VDADELRSIPLFAALSKKERETVARYADEVEMPAGKRLTGEGEFAYEFFVLVEGRVEVTHDGQVLAELGPHEFFGEIGLIQSGRRTATVVTTTPVKLIVMFGPHFRHFERELPAFAQQIRDAMAARLERA
jgi:CRP-like cAMP-binding protein